MKNLFKIKSNQIKSNQIKSNQIKSNQIKYLFILLFCFVSQFSFAQSFNDLRTKLDYVFAPLNKSQIPTGILDEYGYGLIEAKSITAQDTLDINSWRALYYSLFTARIYGTQTLPSLDTLNARFNQYTGSAIQIPIIHYNFNGLKPNAVTSNLLSVQNQQFRDVAGRTQSPYSSHSVFAAALNQKMSETGDVSFIVRSNLFLSNTGKTLSQIQIDAGNGMGWQTLTLNQAFTVNYTTVGHKIVKIRCTYTDATTVTSQSSLIVTKIIPNVSSLYDPNEASFFEDIDPEFNHAGAVLRIVLSELNPTRNTTRRLMKPLIIVEGYDPSETLGGEFPAFGYNEFITFINRPAFQGYDFNFQLDNVAGYDLVYIEYNNSVDDIRRNAAMFQDVLRWVNDNKVNNVNNNNLREQNVVMGLSMGGLVARFGLAQMERNDRLGLPDNEHETRLLITHDSPHRGANVPVGLQAPAQLLLSVGTLRDLFPIIQDTGDLLDAPATRQLLIYRTVRNGANNYAYQLNNFLDNEYRTMITFPANDPAPYRFIATSNGAECGNPLFAPYTELTRLNANAFAFLIPIISISARVQSEFIVNALPNQGEVRRIFKFRVWFRTCLLGLICINSDIINEQANSTANLLPIDGAPGGTYDLGTFVPDELLEPLNSSFNFLYIFGYGSRFGVAPNFSFVSTASALDITNYNAASLSASYTAGISPQNQSRAANFIAQEPLNLNVFNATHLTFTARNAQWLFNEMEGNTPNNLNCSQVCAPTFTLNGPNSVCNTGTSQYSVASLPTGANVTWSATGPVSINSTTGVVTATGNGNATITATLPDNCGSVVSRDVWAGLPATPTDIIGFTPNISMFCPNQIVDLSVEDINPFEGIDYQWTIFGGVLWESITTNQSAIRVKIDQYGDDQVNFNFYVKAVNTCGESAIYSEFGFTSFNCGGTPSPNLMTYPNPSDEELIVEATTDTASEKANSAISQNKSSTSGKSLANLDSELELLNVYQEVVWQGQLKAGRASINTSSLPEGTYYLRLTNEGETQIRRVLVRH